MTIEDTTAELDLDAAADLEAEEHDRLEADSADGADGSEEEDTGEQEDPEIQRLLAEDEAIRAQIREARETIQLERNTAEYRGLAEDERADWLEKHFEGDALESFQRHLTDLEITETIESALAGSDDALVETYRSADEDVQKAFLEELDGNPDRLRMLISRAATEHPVKAPTQEAGEDGAEPAPIDWGTRWLESPLAEMTEVDQYAAQGLADVRTGKIQVDAELRGQLEDLMARADSLPPNHSHRTAALQQAAGLAEYIRAEHENALPWGMGGLATQKDYMAPDGQWHRLSVDGRGKKLDVVIENGASPTELGLVKDTPVSDGSEFDPSSITTLEAARRLTPDQWAKLRESDPDRAEAILRAESSKIEERALETRTGRF